MKITVSLLIALATVMTSARPIRRTPAMAHQVTRPASWVGTDRMTDLSGQDADRLTDLSAQDVGLSTASGRSDAPGVADLPFPIAWYTQAAALAQGTYCTGSLLSQGTKVGDATILSHTGDGTDEQQSVVYLSDSLGIVLAYQGTNTSAIESLWHDVNFIWKEPDPAFGSAVADSGALVDRGFQDAFLATWNTVQSLVSQAQNQYPGRNLTIVGHSLGAAIAQMAAVAYGSQANTVITFGQPRVGNEAWANYVDSLFGPSKFNHVTNGQDWVPHVVPYAFGARHPQGEVWINPANSTSWMFYPGQENTNGADSVAYDLSLAWGDHEGIYMHEWIAARGGNCPVQLGGH